MSENILRIQNVEKYYGSRNNLTKAIDDISFDVNKGEFVAIMGASGSGKTTILRMIAGLETPSFGDIYIDGKRVNDVPANQREIGFVFQNYALFRHMTVYDNIAFGLKLKKVPKDEIKKRVTELLDITGLAGLEKRYPNQLSGGQRQRVALGRAIVKDQKVFLMDEPLSNLDAKLRVSMRNEISKLHRNLGSTTIYVTHDQEEALTMSDSIVVMNQGYIQQIGTPEDIYNEPVNAFVADFIGESNIIDGVMIEDHLVEILDTRFPCVDEGFGQNCPVDVVIRPEDVELVEPEEGIIDGTVISIIFKGFITKLKSLQMDLNGWCTQLKCMRSALKWESVSFRSIFRL